MKCKVQCYKCTYCTFKKIVNIKHLLDWKSLKCITIYEKGPLFTNVDVVQVSVLLEICACMSSNNALNIYCFCLHFVMMLQSYKLYTDVINPAHNEISKIPTPPHGYMNPQICSDCGTSCRSYSPWGLSMKNLWSWSWFSLFVNLFLAFFLFRFHLLFNHRSFVLLRLLCLLSAKTPPWRHEMFNGEVHLHDKRRISAELGCLTVSTSRADLVTDYSFSFCRYSRCLSSLSWEAMSDSSVQHASQSAVCATLLSAWRSPYKAIFLLPSLHGKLKFDRLRGEGKHEHS